MKRTNSLITNLDYDCNSNGKGKFCIQCNSKGLLEKLSFDGIEYDTMRKSKGGATYPIIMGEGTFGIVLKYHNIPDR